MSIADWDPFRVQLEAFERIQGRYQPLTADPYGRFHVFEMGIELGVWNGRYQGFPADWLRAWEKGRLVSTSEELADIQAQGAETEKQHAERLAARLRELGVDPDSV